MAALAEQRSDDLFGSVLLLPELLIKPAVSAEDAETTALMAVLARLELVETAGSVAALAVEAGSSYGLRAIDAVHLASALWVGAEAFVTNNLRDFKPQQIAELSVMSFQEL